MKGGDLFKPAKRKPKPNTESGKRKKEHKRYTDLIKELWQEAVANKTNFCIFCGCYSDKMLANHHLKGRTGDFYLDKQYFAWACNDCHNKWHYSTVEQLRKEEWWSAFLHRLKAIDVSLYERAIDKSRKSEPLNPKLWDDEEI